MKKVALALVLVLLGAIPGFTSDLSPSDVESALRSALAKGGFKCTVAVKDYDKDGVLDIGITYLSGNEDKPVAVLLGAITGGVGVLTEGLSWKCDKVLLVVSEHKGYHTTASACRKCWRIHGQGGSDEDLGRCVLESWNEEEI